MPHANDDFAIYFAMAKAGYKRGRKRRRWIMRVASPSNGYPCNGAIATLSNSGKTASGRNAAGGKAAWATPRHA